MIVINLKDLKLDVKYKEKATKSIIKYIYSYLVCNLYKKFFIEKIKA